MQNNQRVNIVVALACEARLFLDEYRLSRLADASTYSIYTNVDRNIYLIVSGVGKIKSAAALSYLHAMSGAQAHTCYLNAGIAGAAQCEVGAVFLAHKIIDAGTGKAFYPLPAPIAGVRSLPIRTVEQPTTEYPEYQLVDMEAAGFHQAALGFVSQEHIHTVKIVSDNARQPMQQISSAQVCELFQQNRVIIRQIVDYLLDFSAVEALPSTPLSAFSGFVARFHITNYQRHQLHELLRRWQVNFPHVDPLVFCQSALNITAAFKLLHERLDTVQLCK